MKTNLLGTFVLFFSFLFGLQSFSVCAKKRIYVVQEGDSCWSIAEKLFGKGSNYKVIHQLNSLGAEPHILTPGQKIWVPDTAPVPDAHVDWTKRDVQAKPPTSPDWSQAKPNMNLWKLYKVSTAKKSFAGVRFQDRSYLKMREEAILLIYGDSLFKSSMKRQQKTRVRLEKGIVSGGLSSLYQDAGIQIETPSAKVFLQAQKAQVEVNQEKNSSISIQKGKAKVEAQGVTVKVPENYGTFVKKGKKPAVPTPLPAAPVWKNQSLKATVLVPSSNKGMIMADWYAVTNAEKYRVELSKDSTFRKDVMRDIVVPSSVQQFKIQSLSPGTYFARLSAIARHRLEGKSSKVLKIQVVEFYTSKKLNSNSDFFETTGFLEIRPPKDKSIQLDYSINDQLYEPFEQTIQLSKPQRYRIRFKPRESKVSTSILKVRLLPLLSTLTVSKTLVFHSKTQSIELPVSLAIQDNQKNPKLLPGVEIRAYPGGVVSLKIKGRGLYQGKLNVPWVRGLQQLVLVSSWAGGDLNQKTVVIQHNIVPQPPQYWVEIPYFSKTSFGMVWSPISLVPSSQSIEILPQMSVQWLVSEMMNQKQSYLTLFSEFSGTFSFFKERLSFDFSIPWLQISLLEENLNYRIGNVKVGSRFQFFNQYRFRMGISFHLGLPTGFHLRLGQRTDTSLSFLASWDISKWASLNIQQSFFGSFAADKTPFLSYNSFYGLMFSPLSWFSVGAEIQLVIPFLGLEKLETPSPNLALMGVIRFQYQQFLFSLKAGGALLEGNQSTFGTFSAGFSIDFRF